VVFMRIDNDWWDDGNKFIDVLRESNLYTWLATYLQDEFETEKRVHAAYTAGRARRASAPSVPSYPESAHSSNKENSPQDTNGNQVNNGHASKDSYSSSD